MDIALLKGLQTSIPGRYARALFEVASEQKETASILEKLNEFDQACSHDAKVRKALPFFTERRMTARISMPTMPTMSQKKKIQAQVLAMFGKKIDYEYESISDLLGGVVIQADNLRIDASLKQKINTLQKNLSEITLKGAA